MFAELNTEDALIELGSEPINGTVMDCEKCGQSYNLNMLVEVEML